MISMTLMGALSVLGVYITTLFYENRFFDYTQLNYIETIEYRAYINHFVTNESWTESALIQGKNCEI